MGEILYRMNREKMIKMLEAFDQELNRPLRLAITGASALIINGAITRPSKDIDVLGASEDINKDPYPKIIEKIAREYALDNEWINERAKITFDYLPGYKPDLILLQGNFKYLEPYIISKADSVITKFAKYDNIRSWDIQDIRRTPFNDDDLKLLRQKLDDLYTRDPELSLRIEIQFKSIRPEFIKTEEGFRYSRASEIALYASKKYGIHLDTEQQNYIDSEADSFTSTYERAVIEIDNTALSRVLKEKKREVSHGLDI
ncbi:MAG: hypothetical protein GX556_13620 [Fibrobacter sp.]|nr:hypothetical protein [Fibrobacter sp.]